MESSGVCSICFVALSKTTVGFKCCNCMRRYHSSCADISTKGTRDSVAKWTCNSCQLPLTMETMLKQQKKSIDNIPVVVKKEVEAQYSILEQKFSNLLQPVKAEVDDIKQSVVNNKNITDHLLKIECRKDIIVSGLPNHITDPKKMRDIAIKIGENYGIMIKHEEIHQCVRLKKGNKILIKFANIFTRDDIMNSYFKNKDLKLNQVIDTNIETRVFLNNNYPPTIQKMMLFGRKLQKLNLIKNFTMDFKTGAINITTLANLIEKFSNFPEMSSKYTINTFGAADIGMNHN